jgi:uncharacterized repeat protein (TIGR01451 family)
MGGRSTFAAHAEGLFPHPDGKVERSMAGFGEWAGRSGGFTLRGRATVTWACGLLAILAPMLSFGTAHAQAPSNNWTLNLNDTETNSDPTSAGGTVVYTIRVGNSGPGTTPPTTLTLAIPATTTFTGGTGTITGCTPTPAPGAATVTCSVPSLAPGAIASLAASVLASTPSTISFTASIPNAELTESTTITAGEADLGLTVSGVSNASAGAMLTYTFVATNNGPNPASEVRLTVPVPVGLANIVPPSSCSLDGSDYICRVTGPLAPGGTLQFAFSGQAVAPASTITVSGSVRSAATDSVNANNSAQVITTVAEGVDLRIEKLRTPDTALILGSPVTFTLTPSYTGALPSPVTITDTVPARYRIDGVTASAGSGWNCTTTGQTVQCTLTAPRNVGTNVPLGTITINATAISAGQATNTATIAPGAPLDPNPGNNSANDGGALVQQPVVDLKAVKSGATNVVPGGTSSFMISVVNSGATAGGSINYSGVITMTDILPPGMVAIGYPDLNGWSCTPATPTSPVSNVVCTRTYSAAAPLAVNSSTPAVNMRVRVDPSYAGIVGNRLEVSHGNTAFVETFPPDNVVTYPVGVMPLPDSANIGVAKSVSPATVGAGENIDFTIEVFNRGPQTSTNVVMSDSFFVLAADGFVSLAFTPNAASGMACNSAASDQSVFARIVTCNIATLPVCVQGSTCPRINVRVRPAGHTEPGNVTRTNTAFVSPGAVADSVDGNNISGVQYTITPRAELAVAKTASPPNVGVGDALTYTITVQSVDSRLSPAENVTITDTLPHGVMFVSAAPSTGTCGTAPAAGSITGPGNDQLICNLGTLNRGATTAATVVVRPQAATADSTITNTVTVSTTTPGDNPANNSAEVGVNVGLPPLDLILNKSDTVDAVTVGSNTDYVILVSNSGPAAANNVVVTDDLPSSGLSYVSHQLVPNQGSCSFPVPGRLECNLGRVEPGSAEARRVIITMRADSKGDVVNRASVTSTETALGLDPIGNNSADEPTAVKTLADMEVVSKQPSRSPVGLGESFSFAIDVRNNTGLGLAEADDVVLSDTLPAGMELVSPPSAVVQSGTTSANSCTGAAGGTAFTCSFGTVSSGGRIIVTVPVRVSSSASLPATFTNVATVGTSSVDANRDNDSNSGEVVVSGASMLSGVVFRDFNQDETLGAEDTGIGGVQMTLSGAQEDGTPVSLTVTTGPDGSYSFGNVLPGTYSLSRGSVSGPNLTPGSAIPGANGGTASGADQIIAITVPSSGDLTGYDFTLIPTATVSITKSVASGPTANSDGSFTVGFALTVENTSLEGLNDIIVSDDLSGGSAPFGGYVSGSPGLGQYTVSTAPAGSCGGANAGFNGQSDVMAASGFDLAAGASCNVTFGITVMASDPPPAPVSGGNYLNSAEVSATGSLSGTAPEAVSNEVPVGLPAFTAEIGLVKSEGTFNDVDGSGSLSLGDTLSYLFTVTNTGNLTLSAITVSDDMVAGIVCQQTVLAPGEQTTCEGEDYVLTQDDITQGDVVNEATARGTPPVGPDVEDTDSSTTALPALSLLTIRKENTQHTDADGNGFVSPGDTLTYRITATNAGNTDLANVAVRDDLIDPAEALCATLAPAETCVLTGSLTVTVDDAQAGSIDNTAEALSDQTPVAVFASLDIAVRGVVDGDSLTKTALITTVKRGERVPFEIRAADVPLSPVRIIDVMPPGFSYVPGSARANGAAVEPSIDGRNLTFDGLVPDDDDDITVELTLVATSAAVTGENVNRAQLVDPGSGEVLATARARVTILEEAVFDCSDVIGKVFDDRNRNGYQDEGEPGLPGVRLATVKGLLVTTDPHGRFSIACADIPDQDIGSNLILKLDPRTLPTGYQVTTENPRKVRLTRGKIVKLNFGAAITRVVSLDVNAKVFEQGSDSLRPKWQAGLSRLVEALAAEPSVLRITYVGEDGKLTKARMKSIRREIEERWAREGGGYKLQIETRVTAGGEAGQ